jgi:2-oxoisovalerate dehydrogenase E2 component (dihydrolipoyl transacylase)
MPQLGESVTEGTILRWFKQPGDSVALDDPLCEIETEKVTAELPSPFEGTMGPILVEQGETVEVGVPLCEVLAADKEPASAASIPAPVETPGGWSGGPMAIPPGEPAAPAATAVGARLPVRMNPEPRERFYSPAVLRLARERRLDIEALTGTGVDGRVTRRDVERHLKAATAIEPSAPAVPGPNREPAAPGEYEVVQLSSTRRTIAAHLVRSNVEAPQAWTMVEADVTQLVALRNREKEQAAEDGVELTLLAYFTASVVESLRQFPALNARWAGDELRRYRSHNIGVAVASEHGLVVPVIHNAADYTVLALARKIAELANRARDRKLSIADVQGGTFTVNNTGAFGSITSKPIVNHPEVAIVTMERVVRRPVVIEGDAIAIRAIVNVCLSFDHRALDGHEAGAFLADLKARLEAWR